MRRESTDLEIRVAEVDLLQVATLEVAGRDWRIRFLRICRQQSRRSLEARSNDQLSRCRHRRHVSYMVPMLVRPDYGCYTHVNRSANQIHPQGTDPDREGTTHQLLRHHKSLSTQPHPLRTSVQSFSTFEPIKLQIPLTTAFGRFHQSTRQPKSYMTLRPESSCSMRKATLVRLRVSWPFWTGFASQSVEAASRAVVLIRRTVTWLF